jgi:hypothetical protein
VVQEVAAWLQQQQAEGLAYVVVLMWRAVIVAERQMVLGDHEVVVGQALVPVVVHGLHNAAIYFRTGSALGRDFKTCNG